MQKHIFQKEIQKYVFFRRNATKASPKTQKVLWKTSFLILICIATLQVAILVLVCHYVAEIIQILPNLTNSHLFDLFRFVLFLAEGDH